MFKKGRTLQAILKEMEVTKFQINQCTRDLKSLREKRNELEEEQAKETMQTSTQETIERVQQLKNINDEIKDVETQLDEAIDQQNKLEDEVEAIVSNLKEQRAEKIVEFEKEAARIQKVSEQLKNELDGLFEKYGEISNFDSKISTTAKSGLNTERAKKVLNNESAYNRRDQVNLIRELFVTSVGTGMGAIR